MAHFLDRIFFTAATVAAAFVITLNSTGSLPAAILAGMLAPHPLRMLCRVLRKHFTASRFCLRRRCKRRAAETVRCWSVQRDASCRTDILDLLKAAYPASADDMRFQEDAADDSVAVCPMLSLRPVSEDAMADRLRQLREKGVPRAVIACTAEFSPEARALAQACGDIRLALIDRDMLTALLVRHADAVEFREMPPIRRPRPMPDRRQALRMLPIAALMLATYWMFALPAYLPAAMALLWGCLILLRRRNAPEMLFER